jgi:hypothetical protein
MAIETDDLKASTSGQGFIPQPKQKKQEPQSGGAMATVDDRLTDNLRRSAGNVEKVESAALATAIKDEQLAGQKEGVTLAIAHEAGVMQGFASGRTEATLQRMAGMGKIRAGASTKAAAQLIEVEVTEGDPLAQLQGLSMDKTALSLPSLY